MTLEKIKKIFYNKENYYIYCLWIWVLSVLYFFNLFPFSLFYSSLLALLFTIYNSFIVTNNTILQIKIIVTIIEIFVLSLNVYTHFYINNLDLIVYKDIIFNIILFCLYLIFLRLMGTNFYELYFVKYRKLKKDLSAVN